MKFGAPKETANGETRVALVPDGVKALLKKGHQVFIEKGAGLSAFINDSEYAAAGATVVGNASELYAQADCILKVAPPSTTELEAIAEGKGLVGLFWILRNPELVDRFAARKLSSFSLDLIPRITRAQSMDVLSSQATVAGYKAVLLAAENLPKFFPMLTTAAGTMRPAQGLIIGAGVAGLQAIATAKRLGASVEAYDTRPAVKEQVQSLGARFVELSELAQNQTEDKGGYAKEVTAEVLAKQQNLLSERVKVANFVITTAQVPGKKAPRLITGATVEAMKTGSVIVDLAGETGGNCELSKAGEIVRHKGVTIYAPLNLPALMPLDSSRMYSRNMTTFINEIVKENDFTKDWNNEVFAETCLTLRGEINPKRSRK